MGCSNLHIGPRAPNYRGVEEREEVLYFGTAEGGWVGAEEGRGEGCLGDGELGGRHCGKGGFAARAVVWDIGRDRGVLLKCRLEVWRLLCMVCYADKLRRGGAVWL